MRVAIAASIFAVLAGSAIAQDWTGPYAGVHLGGFTGDVSVTNSASGVDPGPFEYDVGGMWGGATLGYNFQAGVLVLGIEGDFGYMAPQGQGYIPSSTPGHRQDLTLSGGLYGGVAGRLGVAFDSALLYSKVGVAYFGGSALQQTTKSGYAAEGTDGFTGLAVGAGVEYMIAPQISLKAEYLHYSFGEQEGRQVSLVQDGVTPPGTVFPNLTTPSFNTVKVGLSFHY